MSTSPGQNFSKIQPLLLESWPQNLPNWVFFGPFKIEIEKKRRPRNSGNQKFIHWAVRISKIQVSSGLNFE